MRDDPLRIAEQISLVAVGGFAGAILRWLVAGAVPGLGGTLVANVTGAFALGFLLYAAMGSDRVSTRTRQFLGTGVLSSYTTYSTFAVESAFASPPLLVANVVGTYVLGFAGVLAGRTLARWLGSHPGGAR